MHIASGGDLRNPVPDRSDKIRGTLLGTAVGDATGLAREAMSARRANRLFGPLRGPQLWPGGGGCSDDTEHSVLVGQALLTAGGDPERFSRRLAWGLRGWLLGLPAGIGFATLKACVRLWLGFSPQRAGVNSAGNGPAMRCAIIGAVYAEQPELMALLVERSTQITHRHPRALTGALLVAHAAALATLAVPQAARLEKLQAIATSRDDQPFCDLLAKLRVSLDQQQSTEAFAAQLGWKEISGYILPTVITALHASFHHAGDFRLAVTAAINCGGDTDTVAAITGALCGAEQGMSNIPADWLQRLQEWPRSRDWMVKLADQLADNQGATSALPVCLPCVLLRNLAFMGVVVAHVLRRMLPPY